MKLKPSIGISFIAIFDDTEGFFPVQLSKRSAGMVWVYVLVFSRETPKEKHKHGSYVNY